MKILGTLQHCPLTILINSGSTHNFIDPIIIRKANIPTQSDAIFEVMVANGERLKGNGICKNVLIHSQGVPIKADFFLLSLGGCDAVLGAKLVGPVLSCLCHLRIKTRNFNAREFLQKATKLVGPGQLAKDMRSNGQVFTISSVHGHCIGSVGPENQRGDN